MITFLALIGLIYSHLHLKTPAWLTLSLITKILEALWISVIIVAMLLALVFLLPATIDP